MKRKLNWWLQAVMDDFYAARDLWFEARDAFAKGYETEERLYHEDHPMPQLKYFLIDHAYKHLEEYEILQAVHLQDC